MEENKEIEVSFVTDKELWAELKEFCRKKTKQSGSRVLIKTVDTNAIDEFIQGYKNLDGFYQTESVNTRIYKKYDACLGEYKSLKRSYKMLVICFWSFNCILLVVTLLAYLGV